MDCEEKKLAEIAVFVRFHLQVENNCRRVFRRCQRLWRHRPIFRRLWTDPSGDFE